MNALDELSRLAGNVVWGGGALMFLLATFLPGSGGFGYRVFYFFASLGCLGVLGNRLAPAEGRVTEGDVRRRRVSEGYHLLYVDAATLPSGDIAPHRTLLLRIAPAERVDAALAIAPPDGTPPVYIPIEAIRGLSVTSNGAQFFALGAGGVLTASLASAVDRALAGWSLDVQLDDGSCVRATKVSGPPPTAELTRLRYRMAA